MNKIEIPHDIPQQIKKWHKRVLYFFLGGDATLFGWGF